MAGGRAPLPGPTPAASPQTTWTTSRRWREPKPSALVGISTVLQGEDRDGSVCELGVTTPGTCQEGLEEGSVS